MGKVWYCRIEQRVIGPLSSSQLQNLARTAQIDTKTFVANNPAGPWAAAFTVQGLFDQSVGVPPPAVRPQRPPPLPAAQVGRQSVPMGVRPQLDIAATARSYGAPLWRAIREAATALLVTLRHASDLLLLAVAPALRKLADYRVERARLKLGENLYARQCGDRELLGRISEVEAHLAAAEADKKLTRAIQRERTQLLRELAACTTDELVVPEAYSALERALWRRDRQEAHWNSLRERVRPGSRRRTIQLAASYGTAVIIALSWWAMSRPSDTVVAAAPDVAASSSGTTPTPVPSTPPVEPPPRPSPKPTPERPSALPQPAVDHFGALVSVPGMGQLDYYLRARIIELFRPLESISQTLEEGTNSLSREEIAANEVHEIAHRTMPVVVHDLAASREADLPRELPDGTLRDTLTARLSAWRLRIAERKTSFETALVAAAAKAGAAIDVGVVADNAGYKFDDSIAKTLVAAMQLEQAKLAQAETARQREAEELARRALRKWDETAKLLVPPPGSLWAQYARAAPEALARGSRRDSPGMGPVLAQARAQFWEQYPDGPLLKQAAATFSELLVDKDIVYFLLTSSDWMGGLRISELIVASDERLAREQIPASAKPAFETWANSVRASALTDQHPQGTTMSEAIQAALDKHHDLYLEYVARRNYEEFCAGPYSPLRSNSPVMYMAGLLMNMTQGQSKEPISHGIAMAEAEALAELVGIDALAKAVATVRQLPNHQGDPAKLQDHVVFEALPGRVNDETFNVYEYVIELLARPPGMGYAAALLGPTDSSSLPGWVAARDQFNQYAAKLGADQVQRRADELRNLPCTFGRVDDSDADWSDRKSPQAWFVYLLDNPSEKLDIQPPPVIAATDLNKLRAHVGKEVIIEGVIERFVGDPSNYDGVALKFAGVDVDDFYLFDLNGGTLRYGRWGKFGRDLPGRRVSVSGVVSSGEGTYGNLWMGVPQPVQITVLD